MLRKIQICEFPKIFDCGFVVGTRCLSWVFKHTQVSLNAINNDLCLVSLYVRQPFQTFISRSVITLFPAILGILSVCAISKVITLVVQSIVIFMVNPYAVGRLHDFIVHEYGFPFPQSSRGSSISVTLQVVHPMPLIEPFKIGVINQCNLTVRKLNLLCHHVSNKIHPSIVQLSRLPHGAVNNQRVLWNYKTKTVQSNLDKSNYTSGIAF